jgi:excisionase family DNA binding protein
VATAIVLTSRAEPALDIAGPGRQASPRCSPARTEAGARGETSTAPTATAREPRLLARVTPKRRTCELDDVAAGERASVRHWTVRRTAPVGGSNRLLSVEELAAYLGVPKKTVYGCWRQWGLRDYRVGRYLRFRERHVEEWLQTREI